MKLKAFSLVDFTRSGGATIRITGILNALAKDDFRIKFYKQYSSNNELNSLINTTEIPKECNVNKRLFQFLLAVTPLWFVNLIFLKQLRAYKRLFNHENSSAVLFFEYLDISIGYWLKKNNIIPEFIADVHGIAHLEFELNEQNSFLRKFSNWLKKHVSLQLDRKVYGAADLIIFSSKGVQDYLTSFYSLQHINTVVVDESINSLVLNKTVNKELLLQLKKKINHNDKPTVFLFAGSFKQLGGVSDLVQAYITLKEKQPQGITRLVLVGDGELEDYCKELVRKNELENEVFFLGRQPYEHLKTFHSIADIIVCPDKDTVFSQLLPHIKYFDSLTSGKIVINGKFEFTDKLNPNQKFSLNFEPSNINSLADSMLYATENKEQLLKKHSKSSKEAIQRFSYEKSVRPLIEYLK